jgi:hypothetical protein
MSVEIACAFRPCSDIVIFMGRTPAHNLGHLTHVPLAGEKRVGHAVLFSGCSRQG